LRADDGDVFDHDLVASPARSDAESDAGFERRMNMKPTRSTLYSSGREQGRA
jgi:hypothetical protein